MQLNELAIVYNSFFFLGILFCVISIFIQNSTVSIINILAYSCLISGMVLVIGQMLLNLNTYMSSQTANTSFFNVLSLLKTNVGPFVASTGVLAFLLYLNIQYKDKIGSGHLTDSFSLFTKLNILIICIEAYIFFTGMQQKKDSNIEYLPIMYSSFLYLLIIINITMALIQYNILRYFTTDG